MSTVYRSENSSHCAHRSGDATAQDQKVGRMLGKESIAGEPPLLRKAAGPRAVPEPSPASLFPADLQCVHPHSAVVLYQLLSQEPVGSEIRPPMLLGFEQS